MRREDHSAPSKEDFIGLRRSRVVTGACVLAFASMVAGLHLASTRLWTSALWGAHFWAFLPAWACVAALAPLVCAAVPLATKVGAALSGTIGAGVAGGVTEPNVPSGVGRRCLALRRSIRLPASALTALAALTGAGVLWMLRARHVLLGDGVAILASRLGSGPLHELEPVTVLIQAKAFELLTALSGSGASARDLTWSSVALVSVAAGALFIPVAWALAGEIDSAAQPPNRSVPAPLQWARVLVFTILIGQGYAQLFCGYVENYAPVALAHALVMLTGFRFARGRGSLLAAGAAVGLAVVLHFSAFAIFPAWCLLAVWGLLRAPDRRRARFDLCMIAVLWVAVTTLLSWRQPGGALPRALWDVTVRAVGQRQEDPTYLLSLRHVRDFFNEQILIGPLGIFLFAAGIGVALARRGLGRADSAFATVAGLGCAGACVVAGDSNLGYARNWDLLAPYGVVLIASGLHLVRPALRAAGLWSRALLLGAALSAFHTLPWIALNMSETRSLERFKTLPLGGGKTENTIAFWYAERRDYAEAKRWLKRSLAANPENSRALDLYGRIAFQENNPRAALQAYLIALTIRPDKADYRQQLAYAVAAAGGPAAGLRQVDMLMAGHEDNGGLWLERSMLLRARGPTAESAEAKARAIHLWPGLASAVDTLPCALPAGAPAIGLGSAEASSRRRHNSGTTPDD